MKHIYQIQGRMKNEEMKDQNKKVWESPILATLSANKTFGGDGGNPEEGSDWCPDCMTS